MKKFTVILLAVVLCLSLCACSLPFGSSTLEGKGYKTPEEALLAYANALKKADAQLVEGVQPYNTEGLKDFDMSFLSGFQAEKRDMEKEELTPALGQEINQYATSLMQQQISGYDSVSISDSNCTIQKAKWSYSLLPVWVLTYRDKAKNKLYHYAVNGQTGKVCGEAPIDKAKLNLATLAVGVVSFLLMLGIGWWLR